MERLSGWQSEAVERVFAKRTATLSVRSQVIAGGRIAWVDLIGGQQAMALRTNIGQLQQHVARQFALDGQIVLILVLRAHIWLELSEIDAAGEVGPVNRLAAFRIQKAVEGVRKHAPGLIHKRRPQERRGDEVAAAEGRFGAELLEHQLFNRIIENSESHTDAHLARASGELRQRAV